MFYVIQDRDGAKVVEATLASRGWTNNEGANQCQYIYLEDNIHQFFFSSAILATSKASTKEKVIRKYAELLI